MRPTGSPGPTGAAGRAWGAPAAPDARSRAILWSHVAARASRAQGRALLDVAARAFGGSALQAARDRCGRGELAGPLPAAVGLAARAPRGGGGRRAPRPGARAGRRARRLPPPRAARRAVGGGPARRGRTDRGPGAAPPAAPPAPRRLGPPRPAPRPRTPA